MTACQCCVLDTTTNNNNINNKIFLSFYLSIYLSASCRMALIIAISVSKSFWFNFSIISIFYFIIVFASPTIPDGVFCNLAEINLAPNVDMNVPRILYLQILGM
jgi:hypothetical protein